MSDTPNAMYVIEQANDNGPDWSAYVLCTIPGSDREHGWIAAGYTEWQAIKELQIQMRAAK